MKQKQVTGNTGIDKKYNVQTRISILFALLGTLIIVYNIFYSFVEKIPLNEIVTDIVLWTNLAVTVPFMIFSFIHKERVVIKLFQIFIVLIVSALSIIDDYNNMYGTALCIIAYILTFKYGFLNKRLIPKSLIFAIYLLSMAEVSARLSGNPGAGMSILIFLSFFLVIMYTIYKAEIDRIIFTEKKMEKNIVDLLNDRDKLKNKMESYRSKLETLEAQIQEQQKIDGPIDIKKFNLTEMEEFVLMNLVTRQPTNKELQKILNITESTVKKHLYNIYNKVGVDNRYHVIELFKGNYNTK